MHKIGAVMVIGAGIGGIQASLDLANSGFKVYLVESSPAIGGKMAQLDKTFPTNDCSMCILSPKMLECAQNPNIEMMTLTQVGNISGEAGHFKVTLIREPRYVIEDKCNNCGMCIQYCPVNTPDLYNQGLADTRVISSYFPQAVPMVPYIIADKCLFFLRRECKICAPVCQLKAIDHYQQQQIVEIEVGSIICATGYTVFDPQSQPEYGYKKLPNVVTSLEFERMISASGPYNGDLLRPYDKKHPKKIAWIQCVGSRDSSVDNGYCSGVCCMYAIKHAILAKEHDNDIEVTIFHNDIRAFGKGFERYYERAKELGVRFIWSKVSVQNELAENKNVVIRYRINGSEVKDEDFDLIVLSVGLSPQRDIKDISEKLGVDLGKYGFIKNNGLSIIESSRPGIYLSGVCQGPKDIPDSVAMASGAAALSSGLLAQSRNTLTTAKKDYPPERDTGAEGPRVGVFVCHCGTNIAGAINIPDVIKHLSQMKDVAHAENLTFACSLDSISHIVDVLREKKLNRLVVAACTPRTHEPVFQEALKNAGLNPFLLEFANIREQCAWVHLDHNQATVKAKELIAMSIYKAKLLRPLPQLSYAVTKSALIIGGGIAGMISALSLAEQGFRVHLIEKGEKLGGNAQRIHETLEGHDVQKYINDLENKIHSNLLIQLYLNSEITEISGYVGNFTAKITSNTDKKTREISHGSILLATGAQEYKPVEYLYGNHSNVLTLLELEDEMAGKSERISSASCLVMIQCVGSRDEQRPYCSRVCCSHSVKDALKIKRMNPDIDIYILYRDMRTYGLKEDYYKEAAEKGIRFIRYDIDSKPEVESIEKDGRQLLRITVKDPVLNQLISLDADILALAAAIVPDQTNQDLSRILKVSLNEDKFFLEAHMKLRPVDFASDGIFMCGLAHGPKFIEESIVQAQAAACRAVTILSKDKILSGGIISVVDQTRCSGCRICEAMCPFNAITFDAEKKVIVINEALCKGCGTCAAACPAGVIASQQFTSEQIMAQIQGAFV